MTTATKQTAPVRALLGRKLGMTQIWDEQGHVVPLTVVEVGTNVVTQVRTEDRDGYDAVQIGYGAIDPRRVTKPLLGHFKKAGVEPRRHLVEVRMPEAQGESLKPGAELTASIFDAGQQVDVIGRSKGKGYAGVMKRHGFSGVGASHGAHRNHRKPGSIGACATPGRIFKGLRMAGRMGGARRTTQNLRIQSVDADKGLLLISGAVPGPKNGIVLVRSAVKGA